MRRGARKGDSVTAVSFLICRIRLWHAPSQDAGNLFICVEERGKGGQLASAIRQAGDKRYITARDSHTNEGGSGGARSGRAASALSSRLRWSLVRHLTRARRRCNLICGRRLPCRRRRSRSSLLKETPVMSNVSRREARATPPRSLKSFALHVFFFPWLFFFSVNADPSSMENIWWCRLYGLCHKCHKREDLILSGHNSRAKQDLFYFIFSFFFRRGLFDWLSGIAHLSRYWSEGPKGMWHHYEAWPYHLLPCSS